MIWVLMVFLRNIIAAWHFEALSMWTSFYASFVPQWIDSQAFFHHSAKIRPCMIVFQLLAIIQMDNNKLSNYTQ